MTEVIKRGNYLVRPQLVPVAEREAMAARIVQVACQLEELIEDPLVKETINRLPDNGTAICLVGRFALTHQGLVWLNTEYLPGGREVQVAIPVPPTHYQAVIQAFALTQEELNPEAIIPHIKNCFSAYTK